MNVYLIKSTALALIKGRTREWLFIFIVGLLEQNLPRGTGTQGLGIVESYVDRVADLQKNRDTFRIVRINITPFTL